MKDIETIDDFYRHKLNGVPDVIRREIGHFNVFRLEPFVGPGAKAVPYSRRDYYKISLIRGNNKIHYADKVIEIKKQALFFANPQVPYNWEETDKIQRGYFCIFTPDFFHQYGSITQYDVFQPGGTPVLELTDNQVEEVDAIYQRISNELDSDYVYKYDLLRALVLELVHYAMKLHPTTNPVTPEVTASGRICGLFLELLERQFPIDDTRQRLQLRSASDFARQLAVHVNHLNRVVKDSLQRTTTDIIAERVLQEAKILLKHSNWGVLEIAYALGFKEVTHFTNFFKKHVQVSPTKYRHV